MADDTQPIPRVALPPPNRTTPNRWNSQFILANIKQFPHCDAGVLHAPGECEFCDRHPEWQALRLAWGISFTGQSDSDMTLCPAEQVRPLETIYRWGASK